MLVFVLSLALGLEDSHIYVYLSVCNISYIYICIYANFLAFTVDGANCSTSPA